MNAEIVLPGSGVRVAWVKRGEALVVSKSRPGFDAASVDSILGLLRSVSDNSFPNLKFLVFDFNHGGAEASCAVDGFEDMAAANAGLIVDTPVITIAWVRSLLNGLDFDYAMSCSAIVAEAGARFSLSGEPFDLFGLYAAVGRRIGFVRTERLIERDAALSAAEAHDLMIVKDVVAPQPNFEGISAYLAQAGRRYNAAHAIFRAQRIAQPPIDRRPVDG
ncbi:MAG: enoyl-CoA hydratase [Methylocystis sp.]|nr:MAG: enoyl-CoA hydratase [Methylocystis sp.]